MLLAVCIGLLLICVAALAIARAALAVMRRFGLDVMSVLLWLGLAERSPAAAPRRSR